MTVFEKWAVHSLKRALLEASASKDPSSKVGAVIVTDDKFVVSAGFNGFPRGVTDDERLNNKMLKRAITVHAELNALLNAARRGVSVKGATLYWLGIKHNNIWGGCPCVPCTSAIINAGIKAIVSVSPENMPETWLMQQSLAHDIRDEGGVGYHEIPLERFLEEIEIG